MDAEAGSRDAQTSVDRAVALVADALADLARRSGSAPGAGLRHRLVTLERLARMVESAVVDVVAECDRTGAFLDDGHVSVRNWVAAETNTSSADALGRARVARLTSACPRVTEQLAAGTVGVAQVRELGRARSNPRVGAKVDDAIDELLVEAAAQPLHGFVALVREWEALVDADGSFRDHDTAHGSRALRTRPRTDAPGGDLWARFGAADYAEITDVIDCYADAELAADVAAARDGGDADVPLARTADQRRADALVQALRDAAAAQAPSAGVTPTVSYVVASAVFDEQVAALVEGRAPVFDATSLRRQLCTTANGVAVDPAVVVAAAVVGHVRRIVIDGTGRIVDVGRRRRLFTGAAREAALLQALLDATSGRCLWPGCGRHRNGQADHVIERRHGGPTDLINASWLCGAHNRHKSRGYTIWRDDHGRWHTYRPDGTEVAPTAA